MAGLLDLYGGALTPEQTAALQQRGLLGFLGGMQKSGALDYTAPFLSGKVPGGFAAALAGGAGGMGEAQDSGALNAMRAQQLGLQAQMTRANLATLSQEGDIASKLFGGQGGAPSTAGPSTAAPGGQPTGGILPPVGAPLDAIQTALWKTESNGRFGGVPDGTAGEIGPMQIMPSTAKQYGATESDLRDDTKNFQVGSTIINDLSQRYKGDPLAIAVAYNAGPGAADKWLAAGRDPAALPKSTRDVYLPTFQRNLAAITAQGAPQGNPAPAAPQGILPPMAGNAAPGAQGTPFSQVTGQQPPMPSPMPQPAAAAPGGMMPGGAMMPGGINPQAAQALAFLRTARGAPVPDFINQAGSMPFVGPKAAAEAWGKVPADLYTKWHTPMDLRVNGMALDPSSGRIIARNPAMPEGYTVGQGPNGQPVAEEVPGAIPGIAKSEQAKVGGKYQAEFGGIPGVQPGATAQPNAAGPMSAPSKEPIPTPRGTMLPPTSEQFMPQSPSELEHAIPAWQKKTDEWNAGIAPARQAEMRLSTIADAFKMTESGAFETHKADLAVALKALGIDPSLAIQTNPAAVQEALHDNILTTLPLLKAATPRPSQIEFMSVSQNREHPNLQPSANLRMLSEDIALVRQAQQLPADWNMAQQQGWRNPQSFETAWSTLNPLDKARSQAASDVGPLKGMPGGPGSPPAPRRGVWNQKTGAVEWQ